MNLKKDLENTMTQYIEKASESLDNVAKKVKEMSEIDNSGQKGQESIIK